MCRRKYMKTLSDDAVVRIVYRRQVVDVLIDCQYTLLSK